MKQIILSTIQYYNTFLPLANLHKELFHVRSLGNKLVAVTMSLVFADTFNY